MEYHDSFSDDQSAMHDTFGRRLHYLRVSLTDACNLRCVYCMPEDITFRPAATLLQDDEILTLVKVAASLGVDKVRLTGGEPTIRRGVVELVRAISAIPGIQRIAMTTNGIRLGEPRVRWPTPASARSTSASTAYNRIASTRSPGAAISTTCGAGSMRPRRRVWIRSS